MDFSRSDPQHILFFAGQPANLPAKKARQAPFRHCDSDADLELLSRQDFLRGVFVFRENFLGENLTKKKIELVGLLLLIFSPFHFSNSYALFFLN